MTALLLLLASAPAGAGPRFEISEAEAIAKARAKAEMLGVGVVGTPTAMSVQRDNDKIWRVDLAPSVFIELASADGKLVGFQDSTFLAAKPLSGWSSRIARASARSRAVKFARTLGIPASWVVGRTSFDGTGKNRWPERAQLTFEDRPLGYRFLVEGNTANVTLNPKTGALTSFSLMEGITVERTAIRLRTDQAGTVARKWRTENRSDPRPKVKGAIRLGWALLDKESRIARLVYDVPFQIETHWVDANNGRVVGGRVTKDVPR